MSRWRGQHRAGGAAALAKAGRAGRKPLLTGEQLSQLVESLKRGPEAHGYDAPLWTCDRVGHVIEEQFGVAYHPGHVWKILRQLSRTIVFIDESGLSQRPHRRRTWAPVWSKNSICLNPIMVAG